MKLLKRLLIACGLGFLGLSGLAVIAVAGVIYGLSRITIVIPPPPPRVLPETNVVQSPTSTQFATTPSKERSSSQRGYQESLSEKAYEKLTGKEIVHRKDGSTYERNAPKHRK